MRAYKMRVEFYDVDGFNVVWHGNYVKFLEVARSNFLREIGFDYMVAKSLNLAYPMAKMDFKFINPLFFGDEFYTKIWLRGIDGFLKFDYEIVRLSRANSTCTKDIDSKIALASTAQICFDLEHKVSLYKAPSVLENATKGRICER